MTLDENVPMRALSQVRCPIHFIAARQDDMVPVSFVERGHAKAIHPGKRLDIFDCAHFDLYLSYRRESADAQVLFLHQHLDGSGDRDAATKQSGAT